MELRSGNICQAAFAGGRSAVQTSQRASASLRRFGSYRCFDLCPSRVSSPACRPQTCFQEARGNEKKRDLRAYLHPADPKLSDRHSVDRDFSVWTHLKRSLLLAGWEEGQKPHPGPSLAFLLQAGTKAVAAEGRALWLCFSPGCKVGLTKLDRCR